MSNPPRACLWNVGGNRSTRRKPTRTQEGHAKLRTESTQPRIELDNFSLGKTLPSFLIRRLQVNSKMKGLLIVCTLCAILATGQTLQCYKCVGTATNCTETNVTCNDNVTYCGTWSIRESFAGITTDVLVKNCANLPEQCNGTVESWSPSSYLAAVGRCCTTDLCNVNKFNVTIANSTVDSNTTGCPCSVPCGTSSGIPANCTQMKHNMCMNMTLTILHGGISGNVWMKQGCLARKDCYTSSSKESSSLYVHQLSEYCCDAGTCSTTAPPGASTVLYPYSVLVSIMAGVIILKYVF